MASTNDSIDVLHHASLNCSLRGDSSGSSVQYRNLKYASIPARYQDSILNDKLAAGEDGILDATRFGPSCPHFRGSQAWDLTLVGKVSVPCVEGQGATEKMDEFECLQLNVTVPNTVRKDSGAKLPVLVWVHGGGLAVGSNNWPQYDIRKLVERSAEIGKPVIGVSINYRVGVWGFLTSEEIGAKGNMGFKDQVMAFRWIRKHIAGFGGDPTNVTAMGESAGGISLSTLLCADVGPEGLFDRVAIMSGDATLRRPNSRLWHQLLYNDQASILGTDPNDRDQLRTVLLETDAETLAQKLPFVQHFVGVTDGSFLRRPLTLDIMADPYSSEQKPAWCKEFVMGDTKHDGTILKSRVMDQPDVLTLFHKATSTYLNPQQTTDLLKAYSLPHDPSAPAKDHLHNLLELGSDLRFYLPTLCAHRGWKASTSKGSRHHFHITNPFDGDFKGIASHELDVAFLLQHFNDQLSPQNVRIAQEMADQFLGFANGEGWVEDGKVIVFSDEGIQKVDEDKYDEEWRGGRGKVLEGIGAERLRRVAEMWQGVRLEEDLRADSVTQPLVRTHTDRP